jgi:hypothetical protein
MELQLQNAAQSKIADLLWAAQTKQEVEVIMRVFGIDARIVYEMMLAATYDQVEETDLAERVLVDIMSK